MEALFLDAKFVVSPIITTMVISVCIIIKILSVWSRFRLSIDGLSQLSACKLSMSLQDTSVTWSGYDSPDWQTCILLSNMHYSVL